jgi:hypothetical protein
MNGRDSELDVRLRTLHDAPVGALPRSGGEIRRAARRREYRNRVVATVGSFAVVAAVAVFGPWWRSTQTPLPGESPSVTSTAAVSPVPMPWTDPSHYRPAYVDALSVADGGLRVTLTDAVYTPLATPDTFVLTRRPDGQPRTLILAPGAGLYVPVVYVSDQCGSAGVSCDNATGFAAVSPEWLRSYVDPENPGTAEFWYVLDGTGRIALLYQVYHP